MDKKEIDTPNPDEISSLIQRYRLILKSGIIGAAELKLNFIGRVHELGIDRSADQLQRLWNSQVMKPEMTPQLIGIQQVYRSSGTGQVSLFHGDVFQLSSEQWICSAFQDNVSPSGGAWNGFWAAAGRAGQAWNRNEDPPLRRVDPDNQVALLDVNPKRDGGFPTIVVFGMGSRRQAMAHLSDSSSDWIEAAYFDTLRICRILAREGRLGSRIACPILFSTLHGISFETSISLQRDFALDLLRQETSVREVMISVYQDEMVDHLLHAWHLASGDQNCIEFESLPDWIQQGVTQLSHELRLLFIQSHELELDLIEGLNALITKTKQSHLFLNDIAVLSRNILEQWAKASCAKARLKENENLATMISQLRGRSGSPNRSIHYLDAIRELGNVGAHFKVAPHPLEPTDLITILEGLIAMLKLNEEFITQSQFT